jgi:hypothetical protein
MDEPMTPAFWPHSIDTESTLLMARDIWHEIATRRSPINIILTCTCGWQRQFSRHQNALARAAKVRAAEAEHLHLNDARKPKQVTTWRTCPICGGRATKLLNLNTGKYTCQDCRHEYDFPLQHNA